MRMRAALYHELFVFLADEITTYIFFQQIRRTFRNVNISDQKTSVILRNMSADPIPSSREIVNYRSDDKRYQVFQRLRGQLLSVVELYEKRRQNALTLPHFNITLQRNFDTIKVAARLSNYTIEVEVPQQLDTQLHSRVSNNSAHRFLLFLCALRYQREYILSNKLLSVDDFWGRADDIVMFLKRCNGKKQLVLSAADLGFN